MKIGIDIGYGFTKAINESGEKLIFPSLVAPAGHDTLSEIFSQTEEYRVKINGYYNNELLVGEAAKHSFAVTQVLNKEKPAELHDPLVLTCASLLGHNNPELTIGVGLPLAYYASQKNKLQDRLNKLASYININGKDYSIAKITARVFPQGAGVLLASNGLPSKGYIGVIDPGTYTTEFLLFEMRKGQPVPIHEACGSVEVGSNLVYTAVAHEFQVQTGSPLPIGMEEKITLQALASETVKYYERDYSFTDIAYSARNNVAIAISQKVLAAWGNRTGYIGRTYLAGGGTLFFGASLYKSFPGVTVVDDPVFANAHGYLAFL